MNGKRKKGTRANPVTRIVTRGSQSRLTDMGPNPSSFSGISLTVGLLIVGAAVKFLKVPSDEKSKVRLYA